MSLDILDIFGLSNHWMYFFLESFSGKCKFRLNWDTVAEMGGWLWWCLNFELFLDLLEILAYFQLSDLCSTDFFNPSIPKYIHLLLSW